MQVGGWDGGDAAPRTCFSSSVASHTRGGLGAPALAGKTGRPSHALGPPVAGPRRCPRACTTWASTDSSSSASPPISPGATGPVPAPRASGGRNACDPGGGGAYSFWGGPLRGRTWLGRGPGGSGGAAEGQKRPMEAAGTVMEGGTRRLRQPAPRASQSAARGVGAGPEGGAWAGVGRGRGGRGGSGAPSVEAGPGRRPRKRALQSWGSRALTLRLPGKLEVRQKPGGAGLGLREEPEGPRGSRGMGGRGRRAGRGGCALPAGQLELCHRARPPVSDLGAGEARGGAGVQAWVRVGSRGRRGLS